VKKLKHQIRNFFGFSKTETNGFVLLLVIISIALFSKPVYHVWISNRPVDFSKERKTLDSLTAQWELQKIETNTIPIDEEIAVTFFEFNPNTVTAEELKALGFSERLKKGLINYRTKGGEFRIKSDLKKLYGMDPAFYESLYSFIQLPEKITYEKAAVSESKKKSEAFNLNEADTIQLQKIYGIGSVLANRIVKYRERLGGFINADQVREVYGLDSVVIKQILKASFLDENFTPRKININTADETLLSAHPYFSKKSARAIVTYRFQHQKYQSIDDLRKIELLDQQTINKIYPYVTIE
jgi:competence protein ComEA